MGHQAHLETRLGIGVGKEGRLEGLGGLGCFRPCQAQLVPTAQLGRAWGAEAGSARQCGGLGRTIILGSTGSSVLTLAPLTAASLLQL